MKLTLTKNFLLSSIGKKAVIAFTGLLLTVFILLHLAGNLLLFKGEPVYNGWMEALTGNPVTPLLEFCLGAVFALHASAWLWMRAADLMKARGGHEVHKWQGGRTIASATMPYSAALILVFIVFHLSTVRFADHSMGFYQLITNAFRQPLFAAVNVAGPAALALYLSHGIPAWFQALGLSHPRYDPLIKGCGYAAAAAMAVLALIPLYFYFGLDLKTAEAASQMVIIQ